MKLFLVTDAKGKEILEKCIYHEYMQDVLVDGTKKGKFVFGHGLIGSFSVKERFKIRSGLVVPILSISF